MGKPSPPPAPDYTGAAQAQGAANVEAARATSRANNPNVIAPTGTQTVTWEGDTPTLKQELSPEQQGLYNQQVGNQQLLGGLGTQGINAAQGIIGAPVDYSGIGTTADPNYAAMMNRVNEDYGRTTDQTNSDLVAAGMRPGSKGYDDRMAILARQKNDAMIQAQQQSRKDAISEYLSKRNQPLNEITALMSGSQVSNPFSMPGYAQNANVQAAPLFAATNAAGQYGTDVYNAKSAANSNLQSGLFGLGGAGIMGAAMSDRRLKSKIVRIGTHPLGVGIYDYTIFGKRQRGVMADEVKRIRPEAVRRHWTGYDMVDYGRLA